MTASSTPTIGPGDAGYDDARLGFDIRAPQRPAMLVPARDASDVVAAVEIPRAERRRLAVQATGHGVGCVDPEAILVTTTGLRDIEIDAETRVARVGAGVTNGELTRAAAPHGLAPLSGSYPGVSVVGYVLAGGLPLLGRRYGWAADHLRGADVVLADATLRRIDVGAPSAPDADLAWALAGGGGSFGIVTALDVGLVPLRTVFGGQLVFDAERAPDLLRAWRDWAADAPDALGTGVAVSPVPDIEGPPPPLRGRTIVAIQVAFDGPTEEGRRIVAPLRALGEPLLDGLRELPWTESPSIHDEPPGPTASRTTNVTLAELPDAALDAALAPITTPGPPRVLALRRLGGALNLPGAAGPVRRDARWLAVTVAIVPPTAPEGAAAAAESHARDWRSAVAAWTDGRLANFLSGDGADPAAVEAAYSAAAFERLRQIKAAVDPRQLFLASAPIPAAAPLAGDPG